MPRDFSKGIVQHRWLVLILSVGLVIATAFGLKNTRIASDYRIWFGPNNPDLKNFQTLEDQYSSEDNITYAFLPENKNVFTKRNLEIIQWLTNEAWKIPRVTGVDSLTNYQYSEARGDEIVVEDFVKNPKKLTQSEINILREKALNEPFLKNLVIDSEASIASINIRVIIPPDDKSLQGKVGDAAKALRKKFEEKFPDETIYLSGRLMINQGIDGMSKNDLATLLPIMYIVLLFTLGFILKSFSAVVLTLFVLLASIVGGIGVAGFLDFPITLIAAVAPTIIMTLSVAGCIHILIPFLRKYGDGMPKKAAIAEVLSQNTLPVLLTGGATIIGFLSLNFNELPPFQEYGNIVAIGVAFAVLYTLTLLPALIAIVPFQQKKRLKGQDRISSILSTFVLKHRRPLFYFFSVLIGLSFYLALTKNELNEKWTHFFAERTEIRQESDLIEEYFGVSWIDYSFETKTPNGINDPEVLRTVDKFSQWARKHPMVNGVVSVADVIKRLNRNMNENDPDFYKIPESRELAAQYLTLYEMSLPYGQDLNSMITPDKSALRVHLRFTKVSTEETLTFAAEARKWLKENASESLARETFGTSVSQMFSTIARRLIKSMVASSVFALVLISFLLIFALKSLRIGLISLVPNLAPAAMAFGVWALLVGRVGMALSPVLGVTLGIVVDDTIYFLTKYLRGRRKMNLSPEDSVHYAFSQAAYPMIVTSIILVMGFGILATSPLAINNQMGLATVITVVFALIADLFFLPLLVLKVDSGEIPEEKSPSLLSNKSVYNNPPIPGLRTNLKTVKKSMDEAKEN